MLQYLCLIYSYQLKFTFTSYLPGIIPYIGTYTTIKVGMRVQINFGSVSLVGE